MNEIPFFTFASFIQELTLDGIVYKFLISWNSRGKYFTMTIKDFEDVTLVGGIKLLLNAEPFHVHPDRGLPPGQLWVIDTTEKNIVIGRDDFTNGRLKLIYVEESEV